MKFDSDVKSYKSSTKLFLIHFAGGSYYSFPFLKFLTAKFEVIPLELPGRGRRAKEELVNDFNQAANDILKQIMARLTDEIFVIYGHSMGALLALSVTKLLENLNKQARCVIVSGTPGPRRLAPKTNRYQLPDEAFFNEVKKLGGLPDELFDEPDLMAFYLPILKADFEVAEQNDLISHPKVTCPIFAMMGDEEEYVNEIHNWKNYTTACFDQKTFPGGHFFFNNSPKDVAQSIIEFHDHLEKSV